jgi:DNA-binding FrmR family transcriptional regulator
MQITDEEARRSLQSRLRRIEGQVRGVQKMIDEGRDCREILQQLAAVRSATHSAMLLTMQSYISECLLEPADQVSSEAQRRALAADLIQLLEKAP